MDSRFMRGASTTGEPAAPDVSPARTETVDYRAVFMALGSPLALLALENGQVRFETINDAFARMTRLDRETVERATLQEILPPAVATALFSGAREAEVHGEALRVNTSLAANGGPHDVVLTPLNLGDRSLVLVDAERRRSARLPGERGHSMAFDRLARVNEGLIYIYDVQRQRSVYLARELAAMLGRSRTVGIHVSEMLTLTHPDDVGVIEGHLAALRALDDWSVETVSFRLPEPEGGWRWLEARARVLSRDRQGRPKRVLGVATDVTERRTIAEALDVASKALLDAAEAERRRVGRELHDSTAQHLVAISLGLDMLHRRLPHRSGEVGRVMRDLRTSVTAAQREIRALSYLLHPPLLKRRGLVETLRRFIDGFEKRVPLVFDVRLPARMPRLPDEAEVVLFRIAQEALMNVHRHADATRVRIELIPKADAMILEVEDDGVGIGETAPGVGITGMEARLTQLGGRLTLVSGDGGTRLSAFLPRGKA